MRMFIARNAMAVDFIEKHLLGDFEVPKELYAEHLRRLLTLTPEDVHLLIAVDGENCIGFCISYVPADVNYVFISQCWAMDDSVGLKNQFLKRVIDFKDSIGRTAIRYETLRSPLPFPSTIPFKRISETYELRDPEPEQALEELEVKETDNGIPGRFIREQAGEGEHVDGPAEGAGQPAELLHQSGVDPGEVPQQVRGDAQDVQAGPASDSVPGSTDGTTHATVREDAGNAG